MTKYHGLCNIFIGIYLALFIFLIFPRIATPYKVWYIPLINIPMSFAIGVLLASGVYIWRRNYHGN